MLYKLVRVSCSGILLTLPSELVVKASGADVTHYKLEEGLAHALLDCREH